MNKLIGNLIHGFVGFTNKSLIKNLIVITLCILFLIIQVFFPYQYYASGERIQSSAFQVGIHYVYEQDTIDQVFSQVGRIHYLGFKISILQMPPLIEIPLTTVVTLFLL